MEEEQGTCQPQDTAQDERIIRQVLETARIKKGLPAESWPSPQLRHVSFQAQCAKSISFTVRKSRCLLRGKNPYLEYAA